MADQSKIDAVSRDPRHILRYANPDADLIEQAINLEPSVFGALLRKQTTELSSRHFLSALERLDGEGGLRRHSNLHHHFDINAKDEALLDWRFFADKAVWPLLGKVKLRLLPGQGGNWKGWEDGDDPDSRLCQLEKLRRNAPASFSEACKACAGNLARAYGSWWHRPGEPGVERDLIAEFETIPDGIKPFVLSRAIGTDLREKHTPWMAERLIETIQNVDVGRVLVKAESINWDALGIEQRQDLMRAIFERARVEGVQFFKDIFHQPDAADVLRQAVEAWRVNQMDTTNPEHPMAWSTAIKEMEFWGLSDSRAVAFNSPEHFTTVPVPHQKALLKEQIATTPSALKGLDMDQLKGLVEEDLVNFAGNLLDNFNLLLGKGGLGRRFHGAVAERLCSEVRENPQKAVEVQWNRAFARCDFENDSIAEIVFSIADAADSDPDKFDALVPDKFVKECIERLSEKNQSEVVRLLIKRGFSAFDSDRFFQYPPTVIESAIDAGFVPWDLKTTNEALILKAMGCMREDLKVPLAGICESVLLASHNAGVRLIVEGKETVKSRDVSKEAFEKLISGIGEVPPTWCDNVLGAPQLFDAMMEVGSSLSFEKMRNSLAALLTASTKRLYEVFDRSPDLVAEKLGSVLAHYKAENEDLLEITNYCRAAILQKRSEMTAQAGTAPKKNATL